ncbi:AMP-binding enzyme [Brevibacillus laterosporus]
MDRSELTEEKFVLNPYGKTRDEKMFKTGDIGKWLADGTLQFLGRADHLVKIRGYRIELGEIEYTLNQHPEISNSIVLAQPDHQGDMQLSAFLVMDQEGERELSTQEIREYLLQHLPVYMMPHFLVRYLVFRLNQTEKLIVKRSLCRLVVMNHLLRLKRLVMKRKRYLPLFGDRYLGRIRLVFMIASLT